jgi:polysaccharide biosynthesis/export protein
VIELSIHRAVVMAVIVAWPLCGVAAAQSSIGQSDDKPQTPTSSASILAQPQEVPLNLPSSYVLGVDDTLVIHVADAPDINDKPQRVDPNGDLRLPVIGRVHAAGLSVDQLEAELKKRLGVYLEQPDVTVMVTSSRRQTVSIIGAVANPGIKPLETGKTVVELLTAAGGLTVDAGPTVRVARKLEQGRIPLPEAVDDPAAGFSTVELDAKALFDARSPEKNILIQPNDVIAVPRADVVYVIGEVGRPGPVQLSAGHSVTVLEAVSTSGGVLRTAAPHRARVLRRVAGQQTRTEINIDVRKMLQGEAKDMPLAVGDILVVPDSSGKRVTTRAIEVAIQMGTMIATYGLIR